MKRLNQLACLAVAFIGISFAQDLTAINQNASGSITAANSACTATSCVEIAMPLNSSGMTVQLSGTWSATVQFETSVDGSLWGAITSTGSVSSATSNGIYAFVLTGQKYMRVRASSFVSGPVVVAMTGQVGSASNGTGSGATGPTGATGATGAGTLGTLVQKATSYAITCTDFINYSNFQATASITFTLPTGCSTGWVTVTPGTGFTASFNLSTNTVTVNGQSALTTLTAGSGAAGYTRMVLTPNPALSTDFVAAVYGGGGAGGVTGPTGPTGPTGSGSGGTALLCQNGAVNTQINTTGESNLGICSVPAGTVGLNSRVIIYATFQCNAAGTSSKNIFIRLSATSGSTSNTDFLIGGGTLANTVESLTTNAGWVQKNSLSSEEAGTNFIGSNSTALLSTATLATGTTNLFINFNASVLNTGDNVQLRSLTVILYP
jgi:hypothetical protein